MRRLGALACLAACVLLLAGCGSPSGTAGSTVTVAGSTTVMPIAEMAAASERWLASTPTMLPNSVSNRLSSSVDTS